MCQLVCFRWQMKPSCWRQVSCCCCCRPFLPSVSRPKTKQKKNTCFRQSCVRVWSIRMSFFLLLFCCECIESTARRCKASKKIASVFAAASKNKTLKTTARGVCHAGGVKHKKGRRNRARESWSENGRARNTSNPDGGVLCVERFVCVFNVAVYNIGDRFVAMWIAADTFLNGLFK